MQKVQALNSNIKSEIMTTYDLLISKCEAKGKVEGKAEGIAIGKSKARQEMILAAYQNNIPL